MSKAHNPAEQEERVAREAITYLEENGIVVELGFQSDAPPSEDVESFLSGYLENALLDCDPTEQIIEAIRSTYLEAKD
jgi:hypothetical protein